MVTNNSSKKTTKKSAEKTHKPKRINRHRRYPVLYLHDGQHMLAPATEPLGWGLGDVFTRLVTQIAISTNCLIPKTTQASKRSDKTMRE